jgi:hypothetical protein
VAQNITPEEYVVLYDAYDIMRFSKNSAININSLRKRKLLIDCGCNFIQCVALTGLTECGKRAMRRFERELKERC